MYRTWLILLPALTTVLSDNILILCPLSVRSHKIMFESLVNLLAQRGHSVTIVSAWKPNKIRENVREIVAISGFEYFPNISILQLRRQGRTNPVPLDLAYVAKSCHNLYHNKQFMALLEENFSVILMDSWLPNCFLGFAEKLGAPFIYLSPAPSRVTLRAFPTVPPDLFPDPDPWGTFSGQRQYERIYRTYLGNDVASIEEIQRKVSFMFMNAHFGLNAKMEEFEKVLEIGGYHCRPAVPLPQELEELASSSHHGFILVSFGSVIKLEELPESTIQIFLSVFGRLKQNILWKSNQQLYNLPENVRMFKWLPQQDLLGHRNIKAFVTHGGLLSSQEAIYHGVPMIGFPICSDQDFTMNRAARERVAIVLEILNISEEYLQKAIETLLHDSIYSQNAKSVSKTFREHSKDLLQKMVNWTEHFSTQSLKNP